MDETGARIISPRIRGVTIYNVGKVPLGIDRFVSQPIGAGTTGRLDPFLKLAPRAPDLAWAAPPSRTYDCGKKMSLSACHCVSYACHWR